MSHYCKIGTTPTMLVAIDRRTPVEVGRSIRVKKTLGGRWNTVLVTEIHPDGFFKADNI